MDNIKNNENEIFFIVGEDIPNETIYASGPSLNYEYFVVDKNGNNISPNTKYYALSREYEDIYYWVYYGELYVPKYDLTFRFLPEMMFIPGWQENRIKFNINLIEREKYDNLEIYYTISTIDTMMGISAWYGEEDDIYGNLETKNESFSENITIKINGEIYFDDKVFFETGKDIEESIVINGYQVYEDIDIEFTSSSIGFEEVNEINYSLNDINYHEVINTSTENEYDLYFSNGNDFIINQISYGDNIELEELYFKKEFPNRYEYPTTTNKIMTMTYRAKNIPENINMPNSIIAKINIPYFDFNSVKIKISKISTGVYEFSVNDPMYYDEETGTIKNGISNGKFKDEEGIVLPWDYENTLGTIDFTININAYQRYSINIHLKIGNNLKLRGEGGKYFFSKIN